VVVMVVVVVTWERAGGWGWAGGVTPRVFFVFFPAISIVTAPHDSPSLSPVCGSLPPVLLPSIHASSFSPPPGTVRPTFSNVLMGLVVVVDDKEGMCELSHISPSSPRGAPSVWAAGKPCALYCGSALHHNNNNNNNNNGAVVRCNDLAIMRWHAVGPYYGGNLSSSRLVRH